MRRIKTAVSFPVVGGRKSYDKIVRTVKADNLLAGFALNETAGYLAYDLIGSAAGVYRNVDLAAQTGPSGEPVASWPAGTTPVCQVYGASLLAGLDPLLGSALLWYAPLGWNNGSRILLGLVGSGINGIKIRQLAPANLDLQYETGSTVRTAQVDSLSGTGFLPIIATWNKAQDRIRIYVNSDTPVETNQLGTWTGGAIASLLIGANTATGASPALGGVCHVYLWDAELDAAEVARLIQPVIGHSRNQTRLHLAQNASAPLAIPTYDGSDQPTHPCVYDAGQGNAWNGYRYWMAMTPYPNAQNAYENPSIVVSDDGETWIEPPGISNPIVPYPGAGYYNSDPCLVKAGNLLYLFYRCALPDFYGLKYLYSEDGINWTSPAESLATSANDTNKVISLSVQEDAGTWQMWSVDDVSSPNQLLYRTALDPAGPWSAAQVCTLEIPDGRQIWHLQVVREGALQTSAYRIFFSAEDHLASELEKSLYTASSQDGLNWTEVQLVMEPLSHNWDGMHVYKAAPVATDVGYDLFYAGVSRENVWTIGKTALEL